MLKSLQSDKFQESWPASVGVVGCGWLGMALAVALLEKGVRVLGSTTSPDKVSVLRDAGIEPVLVSFPVEHPTPEIDALLDTQVRCILLPPRRRSPEQLASYPAIVDTLGSLAASLSSSPIIFTSATSVYTTLNREVREEDAGPASALTASGRAVLEAEERIQRHCDASVVRLAGLCGPGRHPGRFLAGRKNIPNGDAPVNLIHQDDAVGILLALIVQQARGVTLNAVSDTHPLRKHFYAEAARSLGLDPPEFVSSNAVDFKIVANGRLKEELGYSLKHPDPLQMLPYC